MKSKFKRISKSTLSVLLAMMMLVSTSLVGMFTVDAVSNVSIKGSWDSNWDEHPLNKIDDNHFKGTITIPGSSNSYEFGLVVDGKFTTTGNKCYFTSTYSGGKMSLSENNKTNDYITPIATSGNITVTVEYYKSYDSSSYLSIEQSTSGSGGSTSYYVYGNFDGSYKDYEIVDGSVSINLSANTTYEYKIKKVEGTTTWYGNNGTMTSSNCTGWDFDTNSNNNCKITTTDSGNYVFNVNTSGTKPNVSVTYPQGGGSGYEHIKNPNNETVIYVDKQYTKLYMWGNGDYNGTWPGKSITGTTATVDGVEYYKAVYASGFFGTATKFNVKANNNGNNPQTDNLENNDVGYSYIIDSNGQIINGPVEAATDPHNITANNGSNYTIKVVTANGSTVTQATANTQVTVTVTPNTNFKCTSIDFGGNTKTPTNNNDGTYSATFTMPDNDVTVTATVDEDLGEDSIYDLMQVVNNNPQKHSTLKTTSDSQVFTTKVTLSKDEVFRFVIKNNSDSKYYTNNVGEKTEFDNYALYEWDGGSGIANIAFKASVAGDYIFSWKKDISNGGHITVTLYQDPVAESVSLVSGATSAVDAGTAVNLTATVKDGVLTDGSEYTYTFTNILTGATVVRKSSETTYAYTIHPGKTADYKVVVSADGYSSVDSNVVTVNVNKVGLHISNDISSLNPAESNLEGQTATWTAFESDDPVQSFPVTNGYTFAFSDKNEFNIEYVSPFTVDTNKCSYATITTGTSLDGIATYTVKSNTANVTDMILYLDPEKQTVYVVGKYDWTSGSINTENSTEKVTYYFAEHIDETDNLKPSDGGEGLRIRAFSNSTGKSAFYDVKTPVYAPGGNNNTIYVNTNKLYNGVSGTGNWGAYGKFKIYSIQLPIWATSFEFVDQNGNGIGCQAVNLKNSLGYSSTTLNPNRVYLFFENSGNKTGAVIFDESLWTDPGTSGKTTNEVSTKNFKANYVDYNDDCYNTLNPALATAYESGYDQALYFGYFDNASQSLNGFKYWNNIAQRKGAVYGKFSTQGAYYSSIWGLSGSKLVNGKLMESNGTTVHPLFDYDTLSKNNNLAGASNVHQGINFPFYQSTYNGITTYSYDSLTDYNRYYDSTSDSFVNQEDYRIGGDEGGDYAGFFPSGNSKTYGFGTEFDIDFYMTNSGYLTDADGKNQDIAFNFSGDDDVWVYVDDVLVLDLGGDHRMTAGTINFSDMKVYYKSAANFTTKVNGVEELWSKDSSYVKTVNLKDIFEANGVSFTNTDSSTKHTLKMFYMERGLAQSNMSISFNLPQNSGLRVNNKIDFSNVNAGLLLATQEVANNDYFAYELSQKYADTTTYSGIKSTYGFASDIDAKNANATTAFDFDSRVLFPLKSDYIFKRSLNNFEYVLSKNNTLTGGAGNHYLDGSLNASAYTNLSQLNYILNDAYVKAYNGETEVTNVEGAADVTGQTNDSGNFNLLFDQSAQFKSAIVPYSLLHIAQKDDLNTVNDSGNTIAPAAGARKVSDYYETGYTVVGDESNTTIASKDASYNNNSGVVANDNRVSNLDGFYYANYSGENLDSVAMTVTFNNVIDTEDIIIEKQLEEGLSSNARFFFEVEFSNVFGGDSNTAEIFPDLEYTVYDNDNNRLGTYKYSNSGVGIKAGQHAVISGVPVGTKYKITEKSATGFTVKDVTVSGNSITADGTVVNGTVPTTASVTTGSTNVTAIFTNMAKGFTITYKYYDRKVENGSVAHINTESTSFAVDVPKNEVTKYYEYDTDGETVTSIKFNNMITDKTKGVSIDNVIDEYTSWSKQSDAVTALTNIINIKTNNKYTSAEATYHTNPYSQPNTSGEKWVTYYDADGKEILETDAYGSRMGDVDSITVWFYNTLKQYTLTAYTADDDTQLLTYGNDGKRIANSSTAYNFYYNVRPGDESLNADQNFEGVYLKEYGIQGYTNDNISTKATINDGDTTYYFQYWVDQDGNIVSTDINYRNRVTTNLTIKAVYADTKFDDYGVTVTDNANDVFVDENGVSKTRLNTMMNVYGLPNDADIKNVAIVYVNATNFTAEDINNTELATIRSQIATILDDTVGHNVSSSNGVTINVTQTKANGFIYDVVPRNQEPTGAYEVNLTNKNRIQFSTTFKTSQLESNTYLAFAAIKYNDTWTVSDNYIQYGKSKEA